MDKKKGVDVSQVSHEHTIHTVKDKHRTVIPGVNYAGFCGNATCRLSREYVVAQRGVGKFIVNEDAMGQVATCPGCRTPIVIQHVILHKCKAKVIVHGQNSSTETYQPAGEDIIKLGTNGNLDKKGQNDLKAPSANIAGLMRDTSHTSQCLVEIHASTSKKDKDCVIM